MFESLKRTLGYLPDDTKVIANFNFEGNFEIISNQVEVNNMEKISVSLIHKVFRLGEEIEIFTHRTNSKKSYFLAKRPYLNISGDKVFEVVDKINKNKLTMILESQLDSLQIINHSNLVNNIIFSRVNLGKSVINKFQQQKYSPKVEECLEELNDIIESYFKEIDHILLYDDIRNVDKLILIRKEIILCCVRITYDNINEKMEVIAKEIVLETEKCHKILLNGGSHSNLLGLQKSFELARKFIIRYSDLVENLEDDNLI